MLHEGFYLATSLQTGLQMGYEHFTISNTDDGILVKCRHTVFGNPNFVQNTSFKLDSHWVPHKLEVETTDGSLAAVDFTDDETLLFSRTMKGEYRMRFPVGRHRAYILLQGALYFPWLLIRRFDLSGGAAHQFDIVPSGFCKIIEEERFVEDDETYRKLQMELFVEGVRDVIDLVVDLEGLLIRYRTGNLALSVKLEEGRVQC